MKKHYLEFLIVCVISFLSFQGVLAQKKVGNSYERIPNGYKIIATNPNPYPMTVRYTFTLENLKSSKGKQDIFVVPANAEKHIITELLIIKKNKSYTFSSTTIFQQGDHFLSKHDKDYDYHLPFSKNETYKLYQGYNGSFSHKNENALDFTMDVGTKILAAREGVVTNVVDENSKNCPRRKCMKYNNYIRVFHPDGTFAEYVHIKKDGAEVKVGDKITKGQLIGYSGNVGFSTGPHLHFVVYFQRLTKRETLKTKFRVGNGESIEELVEKNKYTRSY
ncbi:peptidoglycan DD-metalloendopeptidase family protein [Aquimarina sp. M1]